MKKVLLINGSPKGKNSNTRKLALTFLDGLNKNNQYQIDEIICSQANIQDCKGCFYCWKNEEGNCSIEDDMQTYLKKYIDADIIVWSFPNYFHGIPSTAKKFMDRLLPMYYPWLEKKGAAQTEHPCKYDFRNKNIILFCCCGYYNVNHNTEALRKQFELLYHSYDAVFFPEGQLLANDFLNYYAKDYFSALYSAGCEYAATFKISNESQTILNKPLLAIDQFISYVNTTAIVKSKNMTMQEYMLKKERAFFQCMALTYNPSVLQVDQSVLEIQIVDHPYVCQLHLDKKQCLLVEDKALFLPYRLKVITNLSLFTSRPQLATATVSKSGQPDFNTLIHLINKMEKKGITKEMKLD